MCARTCAAWPVSSIGAQNDSIAWIRNTIDIKLVNPTFTFSVCSIRSVFCDKISELYH